MTKGIARDPIYRRRRFSAETIEQCVRWFITYRLNYRDLAAMMAERGIAVSHTTMEAAQAFFRESVVRPGVPWPRKINLDGNRATHRALRLLGEEDARWRTVEIGSSRYLNNVVEQDHRAIKRRRASMLGLKSICSAAITLAGIELARRIRRGRTHAILYNSACLQTGSFRRRPWRRKP